MLCASVSTSGPGGWAPAPDDLAPAALAASAGAGEGDGVGAADALGAGAVLVVLELADVRPALALIGRVLIGRDLARDALGLGGLVLAMVSVSCRFGGARGPVLFWS